MDTDRRRIIVFVKYPLENAVKTRLARDIGAVRAAGLSRAMATDAVEAAVETGREVVVAFTPDANADSFADWLGRDVRFEPQGTGDIGARMLRSFESAFASGVSSAVLIGSDIPDLSADIINRAFALLAVHDAVLGPAADGGYYLIGFSGRGFLPVVFAGMQWSTALVAGRTLDILRDSGKNCALLPKLRDIDTLGDLRSWMADTKTAGVRAGQRVRSTHTRRYCENELAKEAGL
jgi:rSAM/selenodomain-associated transferase 1